IYARENGQGMAFPVPSTTDVGGEDPSSDDAAGGDEPNDGLDRSASPLRLARTPRAAPAKEKERASAKATAKSDDKTPTKALSPVSIVNTEGDDPPDSPPPSGAGRPALRRVK